MVVKHFHIVLVAFQDLLSKHGLFGGRVVLVAKTMPLLIGLGYHIKTILVAQLIPLWVVGVVTGAHGIDVELLHNLDVLYHPLTTHDVATVWIHLVSVGAFDINRLPINQQLTVPNLHFPEPHLLRNHLYHLSALLHCGDEGEQIGCLGGPWFHVLDVESHVTVTLSLEVHAVLAHGDAVSVQQVEVYRGTSLHVQVYRQHSVLVVVRQVGCQFDVAHLHLFVAGIKITVARHAAQPPEVLVLAVRAVAPTEGLKGNQVVALPHIGRDVELGGHLRIFGIAHIHAVDIQVDVGRYAAKVGDNLLAVPAVGDIDGAAVAAHMVVFQWHLGRVVLEMSAPGEADVQVYRVAIAVEFPYSRHADGLPCRVVIAGFEEARRPLVGSFGKVKLPRSVQ